MAINIGGPGGRARFLASIGRIATLEIMAQFGLKKSAQVLLHQVRAQLNKPGSGRFYSSRTGSGTHQASAPGEPPAPDTFALRRSAHIESRPGVERIMVDGKAAATLEFGTRNKSLLPRPYMRPALRKARPKMSAVMVGGLKVGSLVIG